MFAFVGTMCDRKNFPFILDVFKCLKQKYASTYKLVLIGSGSNRYINKYLDMLESKIRDDILYVKNIENAQLKFIYESSDMFILPSKLEIFGMVLLEAMYFENCVFTSVNGGSATLIKNGINGFVFDGFNAEVWAKKIDEIEKDNSRLLKVKQEAKRTVNEDYTWDSIIKRFIENLPAQFKF
ncbi:MAG: glycosyltransferase [Coprobacillus cateniformis]